MASDPRVKPNFQLGFGDNLLVKLFHFINKYVAWHKLPSVIGALNLDALRVELRQYNLHDTYPDGHPQGTAATCPMTNKRFKDGRSSDGTFNSLDMPMMGCAGMRFGRNFPRQLTPKPTEEQLWTPNPRMLSDRFMARKEFIPATTLNLLAAAWIQFQTHDWFFHEDDYAKDMEIPLPKGDTWPDAKMHLPSSKVDATLGSADVKCPGYKNMNTAWWDSSQIYGSDESKTQQLRTKDKDGKLAMEDDLREKFLFRDAQNNPETGFNDNWWIGMELLHTLFALEHNAICDMLRAHYPSMAGDEIFDKARLINCALMAKIHTVEWTPGILAHPTLQLAMNANWWGLAGEKLTKMVGRLSKTSEVISGIPGSGVDHQGVPYSLTEEFVSVYRLHTLCPDHIVFFDSKTGAYKQRIKTEDTLFQKSQKVLTEDGITFGDAFYSFGINFPGAITNHNYPDFLRNLTTPDGIRKDLGTIDILRDRERGVPRYCEFRRLLRMPVPKTFLELTGGDQKLAADLSDAYDGNIEMVDAIIGSHSEPLPKGFGFSDMAFRIFVLMASRRLKSDRFIAGQWNNETYTKEGMNWVQNTGMKDVLLRHFPELLPALKNVKNPFAPWDKLAKTHEWSGVEVDAPKKA